MTPFQQSCRWSLLSAFEADGLALADEQVSEGLEACFRATVAGTDIAVVIYRHEAQIHRAGQLQAQYSLEKIYSPLRLQDEFVRAVVEAAAGLPSARAEQVRAAS